MKKVKIISCIYFNQLESEINRIIRQENWEFKTTYSDVKMHYAVLEKAE